MSSTVSATVVLKRPSWQALLTADLWLRYHPSGGDADEDGKAPSGAEAVGYVRRLIRRIRRHWPDTRITLRGDGHYGRSEITTWYGNNDIDYVSGLPGITVLHAEHGIVVCADAYATNGALDPASGCLGMLRRYAKPRYAAKSGERTNVGGCADRSHHLGLDSRFIVTSIEAGAPVHIYGTLYCARDQGENLIRLHKTQLKSDRTSRCSANANQMRHILHTATY